MSPIERQQTGGSRAEELGGGWRRMWDEGVGERILRRREWLIENAVELNAAMTTPRRSFRSR
jgi:hypothetical protein